MAYINYNGTIDYEESIHISIKNRAFRYADGFFETMKLSNGKIVLQEFHLERLYTSLQKLKFGSSAFPSADILVEEINALASRNGNEELARIRLTVFAGDGLLHDVINRKANYIIESSSLDPATNAFNANGLVVDFFREAVKPSDSFSYIKSNNFLPYVMGSIWAKENDLDDCILLNAFGNIADASIANVFIVENGHVKTPGLNDGPVAGVGRKYLLKCLKAEGIPFEETSVSVEDVLGASEVFLTNAITGIRWVKQVGKSNYACQLSSYLHQQFISRLF